jgi:ligand-binding SRPBCC domain-containing protein
MPLGEHLLTRETLIPRPRTQVFDFFADAENLERITPPELNFQIQSPLPIRMGAGALIEYRLRLFGLRFRWKTRISHWDPGVSFVDEQLQGPYALWVHTHRFRDVGRGTLVTDEVRYRLPLFPAGEIAYPLVRLQLRRIFNFRARRLHELLGSGAGPTNDTR